jgi:hypothetical protein
MDKELEQALEQEVSPAQTDPGANVGASRRRFTRNAVVGSAVLFSLGNRAAWGGENHSNETCMSRTILASFVANGNQFASLSPVNLESDATKILNTPADERHTHGKRTCVSD